MTIILPANPVISVLFLLPIIEPCPIAQRRLRHYLKENQKTLPNQIKKEINHPTLRWVFQMMEGINVVIVDLEEGKKVVINGLNDLRKKIIDCFGFEVTKIYQLDKDLLVPL